MSILLVETTFINNWSIKKSVRWNKKKYVILDHVTTADTSLPFNLLNGLIHLSGILELSITVETQNTEHS